MEEIQREGETYISLAKAEQVLGVKRAWLNILLGRFDVQRVTFPALSGKLRYIKLADLERVKVEPVPVKPRKKPAAKAGSSRRLPAS